MPWAAPQITGQNVPHIAVEPSPGGPPPTGLGVTGWTRRRRSANVANIVSIIYIDHDGAGSQGGRRGPGGRRVAG